jgi:hypothetical protein
MFNVKVTRVCARAHARLPAVCVTRSITSIKVAAIAAQA